MQSVHALDACHELPSLSLIVVSQIKLLCPTFRMGPDATTLPFALSGFSHHGEGRTEANILVTESIKMKLLVRMQTPLILQEETSKRLKGPE